MGNLAPTLTGREANPSRQNTIDLNVLFYGIAQWDGPPIITSSPGGQTCGDALNESWRETSSFPGDRSPSLTSFRWRLVNKLASITRPPGGFIVVESNEDGRRPHKCYLHNPTSSFFPLWKQLRWNLFSQQSVILDDVVMNIHRSWLFRFLTSG